MKNYTIQEISQQYDIPASTLRYYEDIGLLTCVERNENNQRIYNDNHIGQLNAITCFKRTGMPIAKIQKFFALSQNMDKNVDKILDLIYDHEANIQNQIAKMQDDLAHIRHKIRHYRGIRKQLKADSHGRDGKILNRTSTCQTMNFSRSLTRFLKYSLWLSTSISPRTNILC